MNPRGEHDGDAGAYLERLLDRAAQRAPVLERRRPALFEPRTADDAPDVSAHEAEAPAASYPRPPQAVATEPPRVSRAAAAPPVPEPQARVAAPPARQPQATVAARSAAAAHAEPAAAREERSIAPPPREQLRISRVTSTSAPPPQPAREAARAVPVERVTHERLQTQRVIERERVVSAAVPAAPEPPLTGAPHRATLRETPPPLHNLAKQAAVAQPARVAAVQAARAPQPAAAAPVAPVQVSIGRIEIKAVAQPASTRPQRAPNAPRLGLDDYLRMRHGGPAQ